MTTRKPWADLVDAYVRDTTPSSASVEAAWRSVDRCVLDGTAPSLSDAPGKSIVLEVVLGTALAGAVAAAVLATGGAEPDADAPDPVPVPSIVAPEPSPASMQEEPVPEEPVVVAPEPVIVEPAPTPIDDPAPRIRKPRKAAPVEPPADDEDSDLQAELVLLQQARAALRKGDGARALRLVADHRRRFPRSTFAEERSVTEISALCALRRTDAARAKAARFHRDFPRSTRDVDLVASCLHTGTADSDKKKDRAPE